MDRQNGVPGNTSRSMFTSPCTAEERLGRQRIPRKGKKVGPKRPFSSGHVWETRLYLKLMSRTDELVGNLEVGLCQQL